MCSIIGTPNNHHFPFGTNGKVVVLGVPILKHFRVVKIKGHNFIGVYPSSVLMKLDARKCIILLCLFIKLKDEVVFSCFSDLHCYSKQMAGN